MCTLTFISRDDGYIMAMNRDEQITRGLATPPARVQVDETQALYPADIEGGTWIGVNEYGIGFALLNWNHDGYLAAKTRSRGKIIPSLLAVSRIGEAQDAMQGTDLDGILPFRLVGVSAREKTLVECRWDQRKLQFSAPEWKAQHWFSSSLSDEQAGAQRGAVCGAAWGEPDAGSLVWLRRLHASHGAGPGPFSICVHRESVETLSYTEIICTPNYVRCTYIPGSPCVTHGVEHSITMDRIRAVLS